MDTRAGLILFALIVVASGCGGNGGGDDTSQDSSQAIAVEGPTIQPTEIYEGSSVRAQLNARNVGNIASDVRVGKEGTGSNNDGTRVLTNHCPDMFDIAEFRSSSSTTSSDKEVYTLEPGHSLQLNWNLQQSGGVPLNGYRCEMNFQVPFTYQVDAFQQVQVKSQEDAETAEELSSKSSNGPLLVYIEVIGSSAPEGSPVFLGPEGNREGDNPEALIQLENQQPEQSAFQGLMEIEAPEVEVTGGLDSIDCGLDPNEEIVIYNGESDIIRCNVTYGNIQGPSITGQIQTSVDYTYIKNVGSQQVQVNSDGS
jgi:hypothetical protein